jgi:hypothetical protein
VLGADGDGICRVTSSDQEFVSWLLPGDLLLFDSAMVTSALIKFADNSPVNHCAVFLGGDQFAHATSHKSGEPAVQVVKILDRLAELEDYNVTALRHRAAVPDVGAPAVVEVVDAFRSGETSYDYLNLIALFVPAFLRSYRPTMDPDHLVPRGLEWAEQAFLRSMRFDEDGGSLTPNSFGSKTLTCSQFAYLCFQSASPSLPVEVLDPLGRYAREKRTVTRGAGGGREDGMGMLGLDVHPALLEDSYGERPVGVVVRGDSHLKVQLGIGAVKLMTRICTHNWALDDGPLPPVGAVVPELVTPKDLWSSPSLTSRAILVRSPDEVRGGLHVGKAHP